MGRRDEMTDDELTAELRRRADDTSLGADWARLELLPAVRSAGPMGSAGPLRLARLAGLAAVAAAVLVLVVSVPLLTPGKQPATLSTAPLGVNEFAARVAAGDLRGETVVVTGQILPGPPLPRPGCRPDQLCYMGELAGVEPVVNVLTRYTPALEGGDVASIEAVDVKWSWWSLPAVPVEGLLVLSVDQEGQVEYVGRTLGDNLTQTLDEARELDLETLALDQVVVVPGWLTTPGLGPISCAAPQPETYIDGLPGRWCGNPAWLVDRPLVLDPNGYIPPEDGIQVQNGAYFDFGLDLSPGATPNADPRAGAYALARRLEGSGCPNQKPPCWQWNVVARVDPLTMGPVEPLPSPTATQLEASTPLPTPTDTQSPTLRTIDCPIEPDAPESDFAPIVTLTDGSGQVVDCAAFEGAPGPLYLQWDKPIVRLPDPSTVQVIWADTTCDQHAEVNVTGNASSLMIAVHLPDQVSSCDHGRAAGYVTLTMIDELGARKVDATVSRAFAMADPAPPPPPPTAAPMGDPARIGQVLECPYSDPPGRPTEIEIVDQSGLIEACAGFIGGGEPQEFIAASRVVPSQLDVRWQVDQVCSSLPTELEFWGPAPHATTLGGSHFSYALRVNEPAAAPPAECRVGADTHGVVLNLSEAPSASDIAVFMTRGSIGVDRVDTPDSEFQFTLAAGAEDYAGDETIDVTASLIYTGGPETLTLIGDEAFAFYGFQQLDGDLEMYPASNAMCGEHELRRGKPLAESFAKSGGYDPQGPNGAFYDQYFADPELHFPPGTYRLFAYLGFRLDEDCILGNAYSLGTSILIRVH